MGIPYSHQINNAFDQVTPLVQEGFQVLETTKNIAVLLAWIEVLTVVLLGLILAALLGLLITMNPDLVKERNAYVTPIVRTLLHQGAFIAWTTGGVVLFTAMLGGLYFAIWGGKLEGEDAGREAAKEGQEEGKDNK